MIETHVDQVRRLPSLKSLYIFVAACKHLNLVRAAENLGLTQGALSRQIRSLEDHIGMPLFVRTPRGLKLTETGDILRIHCEKAFSELQQGLSTVAGIKTRQTLIVAVARSYATRVLSHRIGEFTSTRPWMDLLLDGRRDLADLAKNEADAAIRFGDGQWSDAISEKIEDDALFPVASPVLLKSAGTNDLGELLKASALLHLTGQTYWETWASTAQLRLPRQRRNIRFSETTMMLEAAEAGQGVAIARRSLVNRAIDIGRLIRLSELDVDDGVGYYFCATGKGLCRKEVREFRTWLLADADRQVDRSAAMHRHCGHEIRL